MRTTLKAGLLALGLAALAAPAAAAATPSPAPSPSASASASASASGSVAAVTTSGTSFLTATTLAPGQDADVAASTGDYLYWAFGASAGQTDTVTVNVTLAPAGDRHGPQTWTVELFDGLRRRQACTAGPQNGTADKSTAGVSLSCTLRQVRSWAEPWSGDPLPGTYYVRLSVTDIPQTDLGLAAQVKVHVGAKGGVDDAQPEGGELKAPLVPPVQPGAIASPGAAPTPSASATPTGPGVAQAAAPAAQRTHWYSDLFTGWNTRWYWTLAGGALAALAGVGGFKLTRHPRGHRGSSGPIPRQSPDRQYEYRS